MYSSSNSTDKKIKAQEVYGKVIQGKEWALFLLSTNHSGTWDKHSASLSLSSSSAKSDPDYVSASFQIKFAIPFSYANIIKG